MKTLLFVTAILFSFHLFAQNEKAFNLAYKKFAAEKIFKHASISLLVIDNSGKKITAIHPEMGLAPASCQKVITASAAFELLGHDYKYATSLAYTGTIINGTLNGDIIIKGSGDPTLGSWRYSSAGEDAVIKEFSDAISREGIHEITGHVYADESLWNGETTPGGWIWEDIGNYYGAGARALNWRENQYDLHLHSGKNIGDSLSITGTTPSFVDGLKLSMEATSAAKGTGDNSYIFIPQFSEYSTLRGTIPVDEDSFTISGAMPRPGRQLAETLEASLKNIPVEDISAQEVTAHKTFDLPHTFYTHYSPTLDSMVYWFLKRSINLYGEALLKTLAYKYSGTGSTDSGVAVIQRFWNNKGIDSYAMNIIDGSGLSPANRITTTVLTSVLQFAKKQSWFPSFYDALPVIDGIKMKSGSISGVVSYTGFIKSRSGREYTFAFIVNNFDGDSDNVRKKMWALLDLLK
ncbi:MAG TPA: D-alanyl-D-alanine carboxypeptidase/D-alanyl-D-alanine-endopeptidase [Chitinophagaceae bacterium]|nr:D-alanyl-D-alanine carboxypeptidase/D-alanyl-D-alanine-endopeptidase [Chitinophagaceae bacterium]